MLTLFWKHPSSTQVYYESSENIAVKLRHCIVVIVRVESQASAVSGCVAETHMLAEICLTEGTVRCPHAPSSHLPHACDAMERVGA